jgi:hypothetical protein
MGPEPTPLPTEDPPGIRGWYVGPGDYCETFAFLVANFDQSNDRRPSSLARVDSPGNIYLDIDGSFALDGSELADPVPGYQQPDNLLTLQNIPIMHYLLRSQMVLQTDAPKFMWQEYQTFSRGCLRQATEILRESGSLPNPIWVAELREGLKRSRQASAQAVDKIKIASVLKPQLFAFSYPLTNRIELSAVAREHLRTVNLLLTTVTAMSIGKHTRKAALATGENLIDQLLPYVFAQYFPAVNYSALPIARAPNRHIFTWASTAAYRQVQILLAHEYAHLLLHIGRPPSAELELEADGFAFDLLFDLAKERENDDSHVLFVAARWLFLYLSLDRIVGAILSDYEVDWVDLPIRQRDRRLIPRLAHLKATAEDLLLGNMGDVLLLQAKYKLYERGPEWIKMAAQDFQRKFCFRGD